MMSSLMVAADPYEALGLSHNASDREIKTTYRKLALSLHPDRLASRNATKEEREAAAARFSAIQAAYSILSDRVKKSQYDHIYKYGGFDDTNNENINSQPQAPSPSPPKSSRFQTSSPTPSSKKRKVKPEKIHLHFHHSEGVPKGGIGFKANTNPLAYLYERPESRTAFAGIQVPNRSELVTGIRRRGFNLSFSSGQYTTTQDGARQYVSTTSQFVNGTHYQKIETTTIHPDGRREVVSEGREFVEKKNSATSPELDSARKSWYMNAWVGIREKLTMCHNPCGELVCQ